MRRAVFPSQLMLCDALLIRLAFATAAASARHHGHRLMHHVSWNHEQLWHVDSRYSPWPMDEVVGGCLVVVVVVGWLVGRLSGVGRGAKSPFLYITTPDRPPLLLLLVV